MFTVEGGLLPRDEFLISSRKFLAKEWIVKNNKNIEYFNIPAAFDIEVTSFYDGERLPENKRALMYVWQFGICTQSSI